MIFHENRLPYFSENWEDVAKFVIGLEIGVLRVNLNLSLHDIS